MGYIDSNASDADIFAGDRRKAQKDKATTDDLAHQMFFSSKSTYSGSRSALARMAARSGRSVPPDVPKPGVKPRAGDEEK